MKVAPFIYFNFNEAEKRSDRYLSLLTSMKITLVQSPLLRLTINTLEPQYSAYVRNEEERGGSLWFYVNACLNKLPSNTLKQYHNE